MKRTAESNREPKGSHPHPELANGPQKAFEASSFSFLPLLCSFPLSYIIQPECKQGKDRNTAREERGLPQQITGRARPAGSMVRISRVYYSVDFLIYHNRDPPTDSSLLQTFFYIRELHYFFKATQLTAGGLWFNFRPNAKVIRA